MGNLELTDRIYQGRVLVQAVEALSTTEMGNPFERAVAELLQAAYQRRLREIVETVPGWVGEEILRPVGIQGTGGGSSGIPAYLPSTVHFPPMF
jgi:hypothetical protein